jgi:perosamine synthetase
MQGRLGLMTMRIPLSQPFLSELEAKFVHRAVQSGWLTQAGEYVVAMEKKIGIHLNSGRRDKEVTSTSNGTTALHLVLMSIGVGPGDEVIVPDFGYIAPINAILMCGAIPVVIDVNEKTWCIDTNMITNALSKRTKALIAIDNYGSFADIPEIRKHLPERVFLIQDAAESFPSKLSATNELFQGDFVTTSFYANKILTSAEGGAISGPVQYIDKIKSLKNQSVKSKGAFEHVDIGYNYRISNLHAALFMAQWERLPEILEERNRVFDHYFQNFRKNDLEFSSNQFPNYTNPWLMTIKLTKSKFPIEMIRQKLGEKGIETRPGFKPASKHDYLAGKIRICGSINNSIELHNKILSLPTYPELTNKEIDYICSQLKQAN